METKWWIAPVLVGVAGMVGLTACGNGDDTTVTSSPAKDGGLDATTPSEGGPDGGSDGGAPTDATTDSGDSGGSLTDAASLVARGDYLVNHIAACGDCHTPRGAMGAPDTTKLLAGSPGLFQVPGLAADGGVGVASPPNLTPDMATGLGSWTDAQIKSAVIDGTDKDGKALFPIMPYYVYHNMTSSDADAVVAYLRSIPAVSNAIPARNFAFAQPATALAASALPDPALTSTDENYASAMRGKYLAANVGVCIECHSPHVNGPAPLDPAKLFAGGDDFPAASLGLPVPPYPAVIYSLNITPDATGIAGWSPTDVKIALKSGLDTQGTPLCPPMPAGPMGSFGGMTDGDALDIGEYITHLAPIANTVSPVCHQVVSGDGGASEAGPADAGDGG